MALLSAIALACCGPDTSSATSDTGVELGATDSSDTDLGPADAADAGSDVQSDAESDTESEAESGARVECEPEPRLDPAGSYAPTAAPPPVLGAGAGQAVDADDWWCRLRPHALRTLSDFVYGELPAAPDAATTLVSRHDQLDGSALRWEQLELRPEGTDLVVHVALFLPAGEGPHAVFVGQNPCGNASLSEDEQVRATDAFRLPTCGAERGGQAERYPIAWVVEQGYAFVTWHESEIAPDDLRFARTTGALADAAFEGRDSGVLAAWAWGAATVARAIGSRPDIGGVAVFGHSRRGKVALLAGAIEPSIDLVVSHQSGTAGATLSRSDLGESVEAITTFFPHWFGPAFVSYAGREDELPFDQHWLIALSAPRPVLVTNGEEDDWADPPGALEAVRLADPVWKLLGSPGLVERDGAPTLDGPLAWHVRPGGHSMGVEDWQTFVRFADAHLPRAR